MCVRCAKARLEKAKGNPYSPEFRPRTRTLLKALVSPKDGDTPPESDAGDEEVLELSEEELEETQEKTQEETQEKTPKRRRAGPRGGSGRSSKKRKK